jgi:hypothetical protein
LGLLDAQTAKTTGAAAVELHEVKWSRDAVADTIVNGLSAGGTRTILYDLLCDCKILQGSID